MEFRDFTPNNGAANGKFELHAARPCCEHGGHKQMENGTENEMQTRIL